MRIQASHFVLRYYALIAALIAMVIGIQGAGASTPVKILGEKGQPLKTVRAIKLSSSRLGVPASTFELLGLAVGYDRREDRVYISVPESDIMVGLRSGSHRTYHPEVGYLPERYEYPLARKKKGHFYVSIAFIQKAFPNYFSYSWNGKAKTVVLQRR